MTTTPDRIRTTISLDPEVHEIFKKMAEAARMSVSRCMGEWLADTSEGAQFVANKMIQARAAPMVVMREMQAMSVGLAEEVESTISHMRAGMKAERAGAAGSASPPSRSAGVRAPSSLTGLKSPPIPKIPSLKSSSKAKK